MTVLITVLLLYTLTIGSVSWAGETDELDSCATWNTMDKSAKSGFIFGWASGAKAAGVIADTFVKRSTVPKVSFGVQEIIDKVVWPTGHRFGSLIIELNVECAPPEKREQSISGSILNIAERLNKKE